MAFVPWKDRVTSTPHRYKLTEVSADTYDLTAVPGAIGEAGTPVNAANLNKLIQRDGDDIKDTVTTFTEASTRVNIATGEKTSTMFGKIKKWFSDIKAHAFNDLATVQGTETDKAPTNKLLRESTCAAFYRSLTEIDPTFTIDTDMVTIITAMKNNSIASYDVTGSSAVYPAIDLQVHIFKININRVTCFAYRKVYSAAQQYFYVGGLAGSVGSTYRWAGWKQIINAEDAQTISGVKTYTASPIVPTTPSGPSAAVAKSYADLKVALAGNETITGIKTFATGATPLITDAPTTDLMAANKKYVDLHSLYDKVIRTQADFEDLIDSPNWLGAVSVALVGQFTLSTEDNSGIKIPATVKQIHGINGAKITITNFKYNSSTAKGGLWYATRPTTLDYSIRDLEVSCDGSSGYGFYNCTNLTNCTGTGTGTTYGYGFRDCTNLTNCTGTGTGTGSSGFGFYNCTNLTNCTGTGTGDLGYGFYNCTNLTNCTGTGTGTGSSGYGFYSIITASNCRAGGESTTAMWGGTNKNIDIETCRKTPVQVTSGELTTLNT